MITYLVPLVWLVSHFVCFAILRSRRVKVGWLMECVGVLLGPFAIPIALFLGSKAVVEQSKGDEREA